MKGTILKSTGSWHEVLGEDGKTYQSRMRGKMRLEETRENSPVAVGDFVRLEIENAESVISEILPRENYFVRRSVKKTGHAQVIAANIDQALVVASISFPRTSVGFVDRFLAAAESFRIPQILVFNKRDLWDDVDQQKVKELVSLYEEIDVRCLSTSAILEEQAPLREILKDKKTLVAGHSGSGKSTLINKLSNSIGQKTGSVSDFTSKGIHTTTFAEMFQLDEHTFIIDTPGIKELGLVNMEPEEISDYFIEMRALRQYCKYGSRCLHISEPRCAIKSAVETGQIKQSRYKSYVSIVEGEDNRK